MNKLRAAWDSTIGKKVVMAITGLAMVGFVVLHMVGNLQAFGPFGGAEKLNAYGHLLHGPLAEILWVLRAGLLLAVLLHIVAAVQLTRRSLAARPQGYEQRETQVATWASRTIRWGGFLLLAFIVFHLLDLTIGPANPEFIPGDAYHNLVASLQRPVVAAFYVVAMVALGLHLYHGVWSSGRTLGVSPTSSFPLKRVIALVLALVVAIGFAVVPVAVLLGILQ